eukprot:SAG22_NODE_143_length_17909_cov_34.254969_1_plen_642_part_00
MVSSLGLMMPAPRLLPRSRRRLAKVMSAVVGQPAAFDEQAAGGGGGGLQPRGSAATRVGGRRELLVDSALVESMQGGVELRLHRPTPQEIVFRTDAAWEGNASNYNSVFQDPLDGKYYLFYQGSHYRYTESAMAREAHTNYICLATSDDGINFQRAEVNRYEFQGETQNNIVHFTSAPGSTCAATEQCVWLDTNPACPPHERFKLWAHGDGSCPGTALYPIDESKPPEEGGWKGVLSWHLPGNGLYVMAGHDGIHFTALSSEPSVSEGKFDSQNVCFWDPTAETYREYHREHVPIPGQEVGGLPAIATTTSTDVTAFDVSTTALLQDTATGRPLTNAEDKDGLYTNGIQPYHRAPHILLGLAARYTEREFGDPLLQLPGVEERLGRMAVQADRQEDTERRRYGTGLTDTVLLSSRDGLGFKRWGEAFIRPGPRRRESWVYGDVFTAWGMVETKSGIEDAPNELSFYCAEGYWEGTDTAFRRHTLRLDGFVSASSSGRVGELVTTPIIFEGGNLQVNFETSAAGSLRVEIQDEHGVAFGGFALADCPEIFGDSVAQTVRWRWRATAVPAAEVAGHADSKPLPSWSGDVRALEGKVVRLKFVLEDADLYAYQFVGWQNDPAYSVTAADIGPDRAWGRGNEREQ